MSDLTLSLATLKGMAEGIKSAKSELDPALSRISQLQRDVAAQIQATVQSLQGLDNVGTYSSVDLLLRNERFAGKSASVDFIKTSPTCSEAEAEASWEAAAKAATGLPVLLVPVSSYALLYRTNLVRAGLIAEATWEAQRAWIVVTPKEVIMGA